MDIYYSTAKLILRIYQGILSQRSHVSGELPLCPGAKIIAANHPNATDGFYLPFVFQEKLHFFIQGDVFSVPFIGWLLSRCEQIPVWPARKKAALEQACALLAGGKTVVIFPEGKLNPDRQPLKAGTGTVRLSLMTGAAIIPLGFYVPAHYLRNMIVQKKDRLRQGLWQTGGYCYIQIGCPWFPGQEMSGKVDEAAVRELTARLMERIEALVHLATLECITENNLLIPAISSN